MKRKKNLGPAHGMTDTKGPEYFNKFHEYLCHVRLQRGLILADLLRIHTETFGARNVWLSFPTLSKIESGKVCNPNFSTMVALAHAYGVPLESLAHFFLPDAAKADAMRS